MIDSTPSRTAFLVAIFLVMLGGDSFGRSLCPPNSVPLQKTLMSAIGLRFLWLYSNPFVAKLARCLMSLIICPNMLESIGIRKLRIENAVREFLSTENGCSNLQVWNVGAGFDTLTLRLAPEYAKVKFWELDHPATAAVKQRAARECVKPLPTNLTFVTADLSKTSLEDAMRDSSFDSASPTIVILEGFLTYLPESQVRELFAKLHGFVGVGSRVVFDHFGLKDGKMDHGWLTDALAWGVSGVGEPWLWGIDPKDLADFLAQDGLWKVVSQDGRVGCEFGAVLERV
mmetsp:Transcript_32180/g.73943  ORF Transcript_32180/g.73943 Transcript_32180/m.73943 type:complete len:286 (-) Transcript_32180:248-1105(-)